MPRVCRSRWNLMTWADPERIYTTKATLGFKRNPKESAWATNIKCTLLWKLSLGIFHKLLVEWVFFSNVQVQNLEDFSFFFFFIFFQQTQACAGFIPKSQLKSKISHSLINMGFIGLVMWPGVRGLWKKRSKRLKECLRVILSKNLQSLACCRNMPSLRACEARLTGALSKGGKMRGVTTNVYLWKTSEKPKETGQNENSKFGSCIYVWGRY